jgi:hypothetical protein
MKEKKNPKLLFLKIINKKKLKIKKKILLIAPNNSKH